MLHLNVLEEAGLVIVRREGRQRWNHLDVTPIQAIYSRWIKSYAAPAAELLLRLKRELG
jgi:DNA-binding transcriptional ArsR family regulator